MAATGIISNIVAGVSKLPLARIIDIIGRTQGLIIMLVCVVICRDPSEQHAQDLKG